MPLLYIRTHVGRAVSDVHLRTVACPSPVPKSKSKSKSKSNFEFKSEWNQANVTPKAPAEDPIDAKNEDKSNEMDPLSTTDLRQSAGRFTAEAIDRLIMAKCLPP